MEQNYHLKHVVEQLPLEVVELILDHLNLHLLYSLYQATTGCRGRLGLQWWATERHYNVTVGGDVCWEGDSELIRYHEAPEYMAAFPLLTLTLVGDPRHSHHLLAFHHFNLYRANLVVDGNYIRPPPESWDKIERLHVMNYDMSLELAVVSSWKNLRHLHLHNLQLGPFPVEIRVPTVVIENCVLFGTTFTDTVCLLTIIGLVFTGNISSSSSFLDVKLVNCDSDGPLDEDYYHMFIVDVCKQLFHLLKSFSLFDNQAEQMLPLLGIDPMVALCDHLAPILASAPNIGHVQLPRSSHLDWFSPGGLVDLLAVHSVWDTLAVVGASLVKIKELIVEDNLSLFASSPNLTKIAINAMHLLWPLERPIHVPDTVTDLEVNSVHYGRMGAKQIITIPPFLEKLVLNHFCLLSIGWIPPTIRHLDLSNNQLTRLPTFAGYNSLKSLVILNNWLEGLEIVAPNLTRLEVNNNPLHFMVLSSNVIHVEAENCAIELLNLIISRDIVDASQVDITDVISGWQEFQPLMFFPTGIEYLQMSGPMATIEHVFLPPKLRVLTLSLHLPLVRVDNLQCCYLHQLSITVPQIEVFSMNLFRDLRRLSIHITNGPLFGDHIKLPPSLTHLELVGEFRPHNWLPLINEDDPLNATLGRLSQLRHVKLAGFDLRMSEFDPLVIPRSLASLEICGLRNTEIVLAVDDATSELQSLCLSDCHAVGFSFGSLAGSKLDHLEVIRTNSQLDHVPVPEYFVSGAGNVTPGVFDLPLCPKSLQVLMMGKNMIYKPY